MRFAVRRVPLSHVHGGIADRRPARASSAKPLAYSGLPTDPARTTQVVWRLLSCAAGATLAMLRMGIGLALLALLFVTYWLHPTTAWIVVGATFTLAVANRVRQHDAEAEGALQRVEE